MKKRYSLIILLFVPCFCFGQLNDYRFKRALNGIDKPWHKIELPLAVLGHSKNDLSDLRIYGVRKGADTVEAPYLLKIAKEKEELKPVKLSIINQSREGGRCYITLRVPSMQTINRIKLDFEQQNFDWTLKIEGSNNQNKWFNILDKQRIVSIKNNQMDYAYTDINFGDSRYEFYRISFKSKEKPKLSYAETKQYVLTPGNDMIREVIFELIEDKTKAQSILNIDLDNASPIHKLSLDIGSVFDYYRPISIDYLMDSSLVKKGTDSSYRYNYRNLFSGTLSSLEFHDFSFPSTKFKRLRVTISNGDNQPLNYKSIRLNTYRHDLVARFTESATYFLVYGNSKAFIPNYDIVNFKNKIPNELESLEVGEELVYDAPVKLKRQPLFINKVYLWIIMGMIILLLGWFTLKMIQQKD